MNQWTVTPQFRRVARILVSSCVVVLVLMAIPLLVLELLTKPNTVVTAFPVGGFYVGIGFCSKWQQTYWHSSSGLPVTYLGYQGWVHLQQGRYMWSKWGVTIFVYDDIIFLGDLE
ncbi:MAG TPA: hypothetical protein PKH07_19540 [bacterium]|nr:hypothetical protein [bacterium]